jgi:cytochrome c oxidase assembly protein subunit 15
MVLGIVTLLLVVPLWAGLAHQVFAMVVSRHGRRHARVQHGLTKKTAAKRPPQFNCAAED